MPYVMNAVTGWHEADQDVAQSHADWARAAVAAAGDAATGRAYVNFLSAAGAARAAYGEEKYARLAALKTQYDPTNVFRLNQNIAPEIARARDRSRDPGHGVIPRPGARLHR